MIQLSIFFLLCFSSFFQSSVSELKAETIEEYKNEYPWIVIIYNPKKLSEVINYGTVIHERVVLTLSNPSIDRFEKYNYRVLPNYYLNETHVFQVDEKQEPKELKTISLYHRITTVFQKHVELLILQEPLQLNDQIRVVNLYRENDEFDPNKCVLLSIYGQFIIDRISMTVREVIFNLPYAVKFNSTRLEVVTSSLNSTIPLDVQGNEIEHTWNRLTKGVSFIGGPLYCKFKNTEKWGQLGISDLVMKIHEESTPKLVLEGHVLRIDNSTIHSLIKNVLAKSGITFE